MRGWTQLLLLLTVFFLGNRHAFAEDSPYVMAYLYEGDQLEIVDRNRYIEQLLRAALEHSRAAYGDYQLVAAPEMKQERRIHALEHHDSEVNVTMLVARAEIDNKLIPVRIPLDRGLLGCRVMLIRAAEQAKFDRVQSFADLKTLSFGLADNWDDVAIMRKAGLTVVTSGAYEGLFKMLSARRFDGFSRSVGEILQEFDNRKASIPDLAIERRLLLHYPMPVYFWFANSDDGRHRAERVQAGLNAMLEDGSFDQLFRDEFAPLIKRLDLDHRQVIEIPNRQLGGGDPLDDRRLWFRPNGTPMR